MRDYVAKIISAAILGGAPIGITIWLLDRKSGTDYLPMFLWLLLIATAVLLAVGGLMIFLGSIENNATEKQIERPITTAEQKKE